MEGEALLLLPPPLCPPSPAYTSASVAGTSSLARSDK